MLTKIAVFVCPGYFRLTANPPSPFAKGGLKSILHSLLHTSAAHSWHFVIMAYMARHAAISPFKKGGRGDFIFPEKSGDTILISIAKNTKSV